MRKRLLIIFLSLGLILQSVSVPVLAAQENGAGIGRAAVGSDITENSPGSVDLRTLSETENPTEPTDPVEPGNLTEPSNPVEPGNPTEPTDPVEPGNPSEPSNPVEPGNPSEPSDPAESTDPADPENPGNPPEPTDPTDPESPADPSEPSDAETPEDAETPADSEQLPDAEDSEEEEEPEEILSAATLQEEELAEEVNGGEGIYQEGSFTVLGESTSQKLTPGRSPYLVESGRAEAEEYLYQQMAAKNAEIDMQRYKITRAEAATFVSGVINEHPDLYYVSGYSYSYGSTSGLLVHVKPKYLSGFDDNAFRIMVDDAMSEIEEDMSDLEKAITLHDFIVVNCEYDYQNYLNGTLPREVYTAYGTLVNRKAVCQGYALTYKLLLNKAGIECYMVSSDEMNHAWNLIKLGGQYYQVDTTWDDPVWDNYGLAAHRYMFLSDAVFQTESDVRNAHTGWKITKGSTVVNLTADSSRFDDEFWIGCNSPLIIDNGNCYYIDSAGGSAGYGIVKERNLSTGGESALLDRIGRWDTNDGSGRYWVGSFSGLFRMGDRLYYNTPTHICSIPVSGGAVQTETEMLSADGKNVYGVAFCQGKIHYVLKTSPGEKSTGEIKEAALKQEVEVRVSRVVLDPEEIVIGTEKTAEISVALQPSYAKVSQIMWSSSDETVATVDGGRITGVEEGSCVITASAGGKSAQCRVVVAGRPRKPVFSPTGTIDKGGQVTISSSLGTTIYYTLNGQDPDPSDKKTTLQYTEPVTLEQDTTIKAIAVSDHDKEAVSDIAEESFRVCTNNLILCEETLAIMEGDEQAIEIRELPTTKTEADIRWSSENPAVAAVDKNGVLTGVYEGETVITAETENHKGETVTATCAVTVDVPVYQVTFTGYRDKVIKTEPVKKRKNATPPYYDSEDPEASEFTLPDGYEFTGWEGDYENIQSDTVIRAKYELIKYRITYEANGGTDISANPEIYTVESPDIVLNPPGEKEGYLFTGWYEDKECQENPISVIKQGSHGDITLYAGWRDERGLWMTAEGSDGPGSIPPQIYTGKAIKPVIEVWHGDQPLSAGKDYTISYKNNINANQLDSEAALKKAPTVTIKGKGNFAGTLIQTFVILPKSIEEEDVWIDPLAAVSQGGKAVRPVPAVLWNGRKLANKKNFTVEYPDQETGNADAYAAPGTWAVLVKGCGNYTGEREIPLTIADPEAGEVLLSKVKVAKIPDQMYTGDAVALTQDMPRLTLGQETLVLDEDYTLEYGSCKDVGTYQVVITGLGKYVGVRRISFKIKGIPVTTMKFSRLPDLVYTGEDMLLDPDTREDAANRLTVTDQSGENVLEKGKDYELEFSNCKNVGTAKMKITGMGAYSGTITKTYKIVPHSLAEGSEGITARLAVSGEQAWQMGGAVPKVIVLFHGKELVEGTDYTLGYRNNKSMTVTAGKEPAVVIKGRKNFSGSRELAFSMKPQNIANMDIAAPDLEENTRAGKYMSTPVLTDGNGKKLKAGKDYEKTFVYADENGVILDKAARPTAGDRLTVTVTGKGNYSGEIKTSFRIIAKGHNISKAKVKINGKFYYTGSRITLSKSDLTVSIGNTVLSQDDYDIIYDSYLKNINKGTAKVTIRGKGEYGGTKQVSFRILSQNMKWWEKIIR